MTKTKKTFLKNFSKQQKIIILIISLFFFLVIIYSISNLIYRSGKTKVSIRIAPNEASITLNGTKIQNNSTNWLAPGSYHLKATVNNSHMETYTRDFTVTNEVAEIYAVMSALDDEGRAYVEQHRQEYVTVEGLIGDLMNREGEKDRKNNPILNHLPINNSLYSISYEYTDKKALVINIKAEPKTIDYAVEKLKTFNDIDLSSLNLVFKTDNIFSNPQQNPHTDVKKYLRAAFQLPDNYKINDVQQLNDYYYTSIYIEDYQNNINYAHYRVLLKKGTEDAWEIVSTPQPLLTTHNTPKVDKEVLNTINSY